MSVTQGIKTPECDKMLKVKDSGQVIGQFLEWLRDTDREICTVQDGMDGTHYYPTHESVEKLLAAYFEIDLDKVEQERRQLLAGCRHDHEASTGGPLLAEKN